MVKHIILWKINEKFSIEEKQKIISAVRGKSRKGSRKLRQPGDSTELGRTKQYGFIQ